MYLEDQIAEKVQQNMCLEMVFIIHIDHILCPQYYITCRGRMGPGIWGYRRVIRRYKWSVHGGITGYCRLRILRPGPEGSADYLYVVLFMHLPCRGSTPEDGLGLLFALEAVPNTPAAKSMPDWIIQSFLWSCRVYLFVGNQLLNWTSWLVKGIVHPPKKSS